MNLFLLVSFAVMTHGLPKPQNDPSLETIQEVFGSSSGRYGGVVDNSPQVQDTVKDIVGGYDDGSGGASTGGSEKFVDNVPNDYVEPTNQNLADSVTVEVLQDDQNCASYTDTLGYMCVPYYQCRDGTIITDGAGLIDIRNGFGALNAQDGKCPGFLDVCCKDPDFVAPPPPQPQPYTASCGRRNTNGLGVRIQGFNEGESQVGEWPHMCALLREEIVAEKAAKGYEGGEIKSTTVNHFVCGASLIEPGVVLTGAHCVNGFKNNEILKVRCGEWDTQTESEPYPHQDRYVSNFVAHPLFNGQNLFNDYAVLFTTADFTMDHNVDTICLPQPGESFVTQDCFATGWGKDKFGKGGEYQVILKEIDLPVVDHYQCQQSLRKTRLGGKFRLDNSFLCAGGIPGKDTCKGDGGSPLVCPSKTIPNRYVQAGIVAWGIGCGEQGTPGVYGDVAKGVCFIDHVMSCNGVGAGYRTDTSLGFSYRQCGRWFQDSLPASLPDVAKDGAAHQFLATQCNVTYLHNSFIGDEFARETAPDGYNGAQTNQGQINDDGYTDAQTNQGQSNNNGFDDAQTNQGQSNNNGFNDAHTNQGQTNNEGFNDAHTNQGQTNNEGFNNAQTNQGQANNEGFNDEQTNQGQTNNDGYNDAQINQANQDPSGNSQAQGDRGYEDALENQAQTNNDSYDDAQTNQAQTNSEGYNDAQINQAETNEDTTNDNDYNDAQTNQAQTNDDGYNGVQKNSAQNNGDGYNDIETNQAQTNNNGYNDAQKNERQTNGVGNNGQDSRGNSEASIDNYSEDQVKTTGDSYSEDQVKTTGDSYSEDRIKGDGEHEKVGENLPQVQEEITDVVGGYDKESTGGSEKFVDNVPNDYVEPTNQSLTDSVTVEVLDDNQSCASHTETSEYTCVPYYQCSNGTIITDAAGLLDIRNGFGALNAQDGKCPRFLDVCCKDPNFVAPPPPQPQPYQASCGRRNTNGLGVKIQGFNEGESQVGEWPHMCALLREEIVPEKAPKGYEGGEIKSTTINVFICGASLIEPGVVLTGAHCVNGFKNNEILKVRCGEWDTQTESEAYPHQDRDISNFVVHPLFDSQNLFNDYAVLFTTADFTMDHNVDTICLPQPGEIFVTEDCFATGWGKDKFGKEGEYQVILKEIDLPVVNHYQCQESLRKTRLGGKFRLDNSFLCAGGVLGKDPCQGDGGSPLVCPSKTIPNRYVQAGIVAWGIGCGEQGTPGVYGDVAKGVCFIDHVMSCNGVRVGGSADTGLGFSHQQCERWFQDSLPANLPDGVKDAAAHQFLSTQCIVNYLEDSFIDSPVPQICAGRYCGQQIQTSNDGYNDEHTNQAQINNDGQNDAQTIQVQTNNDGYNGQDPRGNSQAQGTNINPYKK